MKSGPCTYLLTPFQCFPTKPGYIFDCLQLLEFFNSMKLMQTLYHWQSGHWKGHLSSIQDAPEVGLLQTPHFLLTWANKWSLLMGRSPWSPHYCCLCFLWNAFLILDIEKLCNSDFLEAILSFSSSQIFWLHLAHRCKLSQNILWSTCLLSLPYPLSAET